MPFKGTSQEKNILKILDENIQKSLKYDQIKKSRIDSVRRILAKTDITDLNTQYNLSEKLFYEYKVFNRDSAFYYGFQTLKLAEELNDKKLIANSNIILTEISVSGGMYKESLDFLNSIKIEDLPKGKESLYYGLLGRCYSDMAEYNNISYFKKKYIGLAWFYRKKALTYTDEGTFFNMFLKAFIKTRNKSLTPAIKDFEALLLKDYSFQDKILVNYILGDLYQKTDNNEKAIFYLTNASIGDIKSSTKESLAMIKLSELLFRLGEIKNASILIHKANEDANFYGAQQRKIQVSAILPIIDQEIVKMVEKEKQRIYWQYIIVSAFLILAICFVLIIYYQFRKLNKARKIIAAAHQNLKSSNKQLLKVNEKTKFQNSEIKQVNKQLSEANKIKEEYLGLFFTQYDGIFEKFNSFINTMKKNIEDENYDKMNRTILGYNLKREKEKLLENFDMAFVNLFPNFIKEFNSLMKDENKIILNKEQVLTKELRIYALIRLGITQNEIIAQILGYSVNSIYAYKTKIRNNSLINKDDFDQKLLKNTTLKL
jgi:hypothetical protein